MNKRVIHLLVFLLPMVVSGLPVTVAAELSGRVIDDETEQPVPAASVYLLKNHVGGITGDDGRFTLTVKTAGTDTLRIRRLGYHPENIPVTMPGSIEVRLVPELPVLETVEIRSKRPWDIEPHERTSSSVSVIGKEDIPERAATVDEVLDSQAGIDIRSLGGTGSKSDISIRGSTTEQVSVYVDGIPLTAGGSGLSGLSFVPMSQVESIEVYRGSSPGTFGNGAIGGVVNISTAGTGGNAGVDASLSYGSYGTGHQTFMSRFGAGKSRFVLSAGRNASDNDFRFYDNRGTTFDTSDDGWETRRNSDYESYNIMGRWDADITTKHSLMAKVSTSDTERGVSGIGRRPALNARLDTKGLLLQARHGYGNNLDTQAWYMRESRTFYDPMDEAGRRGRQDTDDTVEIVGTTMHLSNVYGPVLTHVNVELKRESFDTSDAFDSAVTPPSHRLSAGVGIEPEIMLVNGRVWLTPRMHLNRVDDELRDTGILLAHSAQDSTIDVKRTAVTYSLGLRYKTTDTFTLRANAGLYPRIPEFDELFGDTGDIVGNTKLTDERGLNLDTGFHYAPEEQWPELDVSAFYRYADDLIQRRSYGDYLISENIGKAEITGVEGWSRMKLYRDRFDCRASLAFQDARNRSDETLFRRQRYYGKLLPYHPRWKSSVTVRFQAIDRLSLLWQADYESECYKGPSNLPDEKLEARTIHSLILRFGVTEHLQSVFEAANLTDNHAPDRWGYPKPGRGYYVTLKYNWEHDSSD